jgi:hypothetical protein
VSVVPPDKAQAEVQGKAALVAFAFKGLKMGWWIFMCLSTLEAREWPTFASQGLELHPHFFKHSQAGLTKSRELH